METEGDKSGDTSASAEEEDLLERSKRRGKDHVDMETASPTDQKTQPEEASMQ